MKALAENLNSLFTNNKTHTHLPPKDKTDEELIKESQQNLNQALNAMTNANTIADNTLSHLQEQAETLNTMQNDLEAIDHHLKRSHKILQGIYSIWGAIANLLTPKVKDLASDDALSIKKKLQKSRPLSSEVIPQSIAAKETQAILTFSNPQYQQWWDQNEKDLDRIRLSLTELKTKNSMMGQEIQQQTETIESLITETTQTEQRVKKQIRQINKCIY